MPAKPKEVVSMGAVVAQARAVTEFWRRQGYHITTRVVPVDVADVRTISGFRLETNLVNGWPPELALKRTHDPKRGRHA